jgi:hypothetical protein
MSLRGWNAIDQTLLEHPLNTHEAMGASGSQFVIMPNGSNFNQQALYNFPG